LNSAGRFWYEAQRLVYEALGIYKHFFSVYLYLNLKALTLI
jgi:hypothetical protein